MRINLTNNLLQQLTTDDFIKKAVELQYMEWDNYHDFEEKYGSDVNLENYVKRLKVWVTFDSIGMILMKGLADKDVLYSSQAVYNVVWLWHKYQDVLNVNRKLYSGADAWTGLEYLANEMYNTKLKNDPNWSIESGSPIFDDAKRKLVDL
jgi:hypothetical protein